MKPMNASPWRCDTPGCLNPEPPIPGPSGVIRALCDPCQAEQNHEAEAQHSMPLLSARQETHGDYREIANLYCRIRRAIGGATTPGKQFDAGVVLSLDMIVLKICRIVCGDPLFLDHWDDIAGYATLISDRLRREEK